MKVLAVLCKLKLIGHREMMVFEDSGVVLKDLKMLNRVAVCARCGTRRSNGVFGESPDGHRGEIRARLVGGSQIPVERVEHP